MQTGTAAFGHFYSQASMRIFRSLRKQGPELSNSIVRDVNHCPQKYRCGVFKSKAQGRRAALFGRHSTVFYRRFSSQSAIWNLQSEIQNGPDSIAF
jgi:hypothetical protein